ncbi:primosome assembly protein PriA [Mycolicibacillus koreensis]|nr:primosome assembly protein PriA [Mycolicibacillus koreensis]
MSPAARQPAEHEPIARVLPMLSVPHLDREFDYLVTAEQSDDAQPGVRVRVRFHGRLVDAFLLERRTDTGHVGRLARLERVVSPEAVLTPQVRRLVDAVAARYAGTRADVLRLAVPPRHARVERDTAPPLVLPIVAAPDPDAWNAYGGGGQFLAALGESRAARAVWQALPGESWAQRFAEAAAQTVRAGRSVLAVVPDQRDVDALAAAAAQYFDASTVATLSAGLGPAARYRRWLTVLRGGARLVIGTRSAVFAPVRDLGLVMIWDDGDDTLAEPRAPYPHAREVGMLRAHQLRCAALIGGYARTAEAQALVESGWAHDLVAERSTLRARAPRVVASDDGGYAGSTEAADPAARTARLPLVALRAARTALAAGASVLVQVPRRGYLPALACARCRSVVRCRHCTGPLALPARSASPVCRWCGRADPALRCGHCGSDAVRAVVVGARRTAEELGRAFPGTTVVTSTGDTVVTDLAEHAHAPVLAIATPGAEPSAPGGYGAALLLDSWALLGRQDLRAAEDTLRRWLAAATLVRAHRDGGTVVVVAESTIPTVQALIRWDPVGHAAGELAARTEVGLPPAVHLAAVDGAPDAVAAVIAEAALPAGAELLGPVELPVGARRPAGTDGPVERMLVRVPRHDGLALAAALRRAVAVLSARHGTQPTRVQIDPLHVG